MDNYKSRLIALHEAQTQKGIDKYGTVLEQNTDDVFKRLDHFRQEMLDGLNYSFWLEDELRKLGIGKSCNSCKNTVTVDGEKFCHFSDEKTCVCKSSDYCFWEQVKNCETCGDSKDSKSYCFSCKKNNYVNWMPERIRPEVTD